MFPAKDRGRIPSHWREFDGRRSVLLSANSNRKAERPVNAILNYLYALCEIEAVLACSIVGLPPRLRILHLDAKGRASMALDLIEPVRPVVDEFVLDFIASRTFHKGDFVETGDGHVRLCAPLTHELAETLPRWRGALAALAESMAHKFGRFMDDKYVPTTPLTRSKSKNAQAELEARRRSWGIARRIASSEGPRQRASGSVSLAIWTCPDCGGPVTNTRHVRCDACIEADPRQSEEIRTRRGRAIANRRRTLSEWDAAISD
jgi:hypothetical protein